MTTIDYVGIVAALGIYSYALVWLCRTIGDLARTDEE